MSSWSCPYLDERFDHCNRLNTPCVPGRPGCVMPRTLVFATPLAERIRRADESARRARRSPTPNRAGRAQANPGESNRDG